MKITLAGAAGDELAVMLLDEFGGGAVVLDATPTPYGKWFITDGISGTVYAHRYDVGKHQRLSCTRYRPHTCSANLS